jgi:hypothetical protein
MRKLQREEEVENIFFEYTVNTGPKIRGANDLT